MKVAASFLFLGFVCCAQAAVAQGYPAPYYQMGSNNYHHASTAAEGRARGLADVIRSSGAANLMHSEASKNYEDARKKYIENRLQATQTYFDMKRINKQARAELRGQPPSQEQLIRVSQSKLPDRPKANQLDPLTGALNWPMVLRAKDFEADRKQLETLFASRASEGFMDPNQYAEVRAITSKMREGVGRMARAYPGNATIDARKFLDSLAYEAGFQSG